MPPGLQERKARERLLKFPGVRREGAPAPTFSKESQAVVGVPVPHRANLVTASKGQSLGVPGVVLQTGEDLTSSRPSQAHSIPSVF